MSTEIIVCSICKSRDFSPSEWKEVLKVSSSLGIVRQSLRWDLYEPDFLRLEPEYTREKLTLIYEPSLECLCITTRLAEILDLDLLELTSSEYEVLGCDLIAECFTTLSNSEWDLFS